MSQQSYLLTGLSDAQCGQNFYDEAKGGQNVNGLFNFQFVIKSYDLMEISEKLCIWISFTSVKGNLETIQAMVLFEKFKCNFIKGLAPVHCVVYRLALLYKTQHTDGGERTVFLCVKQSINNVVSKKLNGFCASAHLASKLSVSLRYGELC